MRGIEAAPKAASHAWQDIDRRMQAIGGIAPFRTWPGDAIRRLAQASRVVVCARDVTILPRRGGRDAVALVVDGIVQASASDAEGRRVTFKLATAGRLYGMLPLIDGQGMPNDVDAVEPTTVLLIPRAAVRAELAGNPALWESVALEVGGRARNFAEMLTRFIFDPLRPRMAGLLLGLAGADAVGRSGPVSIDLPLPQARLAEMLCVSRQTATLLVREMVRDGLVRWRYGRVTLLDLERLRAIAAESVEVRVP